MGLRGPRWAGRRRFVAVVSASAAATVSAVGFASDPAAATNFGSGGGLYVANNKWHGYEFESSVPSAWRASLLATIANDYEPTDLITAQQADGTDDVDVRVFAGNDPDAGFFARVLCPADAIVSGTDPNRSCYRQVIKINLAVSASPQQRKSVACQEFGHTVGLRHAYSDHPQFNTTCMRDGSISPQLFPMELAQHDIDHINGYY